MNGFQEAMNLDINSVKPHPSNPRKGDVAKIVESIKANGFYGAIVVQKSTMMILAGNHRWQAAKQCDMTTIPAIVVDVDDLEAKKILLADNRTSDFAVYDTNELTKLLKSVISDDSLLGTGFDANDLDKLIADVTDAPNDKRKRNLRAVPILLLVD
jgi:ParB/RepB/Spo0J family partition protein